MGTDKFDGDGLGVKEVRPWRKNESGWRTGTRKNRRNERKVDLRRRHRMSPRQSSCQRGSGRQRGSERTNGVGKTWWSGEGEGDQDNRGRKEGDQTFEDRSSGARKLLHYEMVGLFPDEVYSPLMGMRPKTPLMIGNDTNPRLRLPQCVVYAWSTMLICHPFLLATPE